MIQAAYIHIPFCEHICYYCDFNKFYLEGQPVEEYLDALADEMKMTLKQSPSDNLKTIFIGGGTPTALNEHQLEKLCENILQFLPQENILEFTFEANPGDLTKEKLSILKQAGVNRISLGVQTFNEELLKRIGRAHKVEDVYTSIHNIKEIGFQNISIDLIFSLPGQTIADFRDTLTKAFALDLPHYSGYSLIIEPKTVFYNLFKKGKLPTPGEDTEAEMYEILMEEMEKHGYTQYEISNFARTGFESLHNLTYWNNDNYYGFGAGAHSYIGGYRKSNIGPLKKYIQTIENGSLPVLEEQRIDKINQMEEEMFLGLRKREGVSISAFIQKYDLDPLKIFKKQLEEFTDKEMLSINKKNIHLTKKGKLLGNEVFQSFLGVCND